MKTAVLIQAHKNENYIRELALNNPSVRFYVHMDAKYPNKIQWIKNECIDNIYLIENPVSVYWGGSSQIFATLLLMKKAYSDKRNKFFHLISSECVPLKSFVEIENEWSMNENCQFIESHRDKNNEWRLKVRVPHSNTKYLRTFLGRCANKLFKVTTFVWDSIGLNPNNYFFGSQWFSVTRNFVEQVIDEDNEDFFKTFHNITCADEHAFAIFARTKYSNPNDIQDNNKRFIKFSGKSSPEYLSLDQVGGIKNLNSYWFCRKVRCNDLLKIIRQGK